MAFLNEMIEKLACNLGPVIFIDGMINIFGPVGCWDDPSVTSAGKFCGHVVKFGIHTVQYKNGRTAWMIWGYHHDLPKYSPLKAPTAESCGLKSNDENTIASMHLGLAHVPRSKTFEKNVNEYIVMLEAYVLNFLFKMTPNHFTDAFWESNIQMEHVLPSGNLT